MTKEDALQSLKMDKSLVLKGKMNKKTNKEKKTMEKRIMDLLKELNVPTGNLGFKYLADAIKEVVKDEEKLRYITKHDGLYDVIAKRYKTTISRVERAIRHAIEISCARTDKGLITKYIGNFDVKVSNKNYISALAYEVQSWPETKIEQ